MGKLNDTNHPPWRRVRNAKSAFWEMTSEHWNSLWAPKGGIWKSVKSVWWLKTATRLSASVLAGTSPLETEHPPSCPQEGASSNSQSSPERHIFRTRVYMEKGYGIIKEVNELCQAEALNTVCKGSVGKGRRVGRDESRELLSFFNVRHGQKVPPAWWQPQQDDKPLLVVTAAWLMAGQWPALHSKSQALRRLHLSVQRSPTFLPKTKQFRISQRKYWGIFHLTQSVP